MKNFILLLCVLLFSGRAVTEEARTIRPSYAPTPVRLAEVEVSMSPSYIRLGWRAAADNVDIEVYRVYRDGVLISSVDGDSSEFFDREIIQTGKSTYFVTAVDAAGLESNPSNALTLPRCAW